MLPAEIVFLGTYEKCLEIQGKLKDGSMTEQEAKALDDAEKLYIISDNTYLHIQRTDDGFDYSLYDKETSRLIDGGQIGSPEQHIYSACLSVCDLHGLDGYKVKYGTTNLSAFLRKMSIDGYVVKLELPELKEMVSLLRYSSNNLNQLTKRVHETGRIYDADLEDLRQSHERLWDAARDILSALAKLK